MSNYGTDALHVPIDLEHDVEVDDDGISYSISNVYVGGEEGPKRYGSLWTTSLSPYVNTTGMLAATDIYTWSHMSLAVLQKH